MAEAYHDSSSSSWDSDDYDDFMEPVQSNVSYTTTKASTSRKRKQDQSKGQHNKRHKGNGGEEGPEWREHHNQQERRRRDTLGGQFIRLANTLGLPSTASRLLILEKTAECFRMIKEAKAAIATYEQTQAAAQADVDKGLRDSPAIQKAELASFENDVAPIMWKSMLLDPQYMTPSVCKELRKQYNSQLKKGLTGYEAVCPVLQKFRAIYPLCKTEGEEQVKRKPGSNDGDDINWAPGGADELEEELEDEEEEGYEEEEEDEEGYEDEEEEGDGEEEGDEGEEEEDEEGDEECELTEEELAQIRKQAREEVFREYLLKGYDLRGIEFADGGDRYFVDTLKEKKSDQASFPPDVLNISPEVLEVDDSDTDQNEVEVVKEVVEDVKVKQCPENDGVETDVYMSFGIDDESIMWPGFPHTKTKLSPKPT